MKNILLALYSRSKEPTDRKQIREGMITIIDQTAEQQENISLGRISNNSNEAKVNHGNNAQ